MDVLAEHVVVSEMVPLFLGTSQWHGICWLHLAGEFAMRARIPLMMLCSGEPAVSLVWSQSSSQMKRWCCFIGLFGSRGARG